MDNNLKQPMSPIFDGVEKAIRIWWEHLMKFAMVYVWSFVYALIPLIIMGAMTIINILYGQNSVFLQILTSSVAAVASLIAAYFGIRGQIGAYLLIKKGYTGDEREIYKDTKVWFWQYLSLSLLIALFVLLWMLLLIVPGIIYAVFYGFASYVLFFVNKTGLAAIKRSKEIITGYWWPVFGRFLVIGLFVSAISALIALPLDQMVEKSANWYLYNLVVQVVSLLISPIFLIYVYNMYVELKDKKLVN